MLCVKSFVVSDITAVGYARISGQLLHWKLGSSEHENETTNYPPTFMKETAFLEDGA
jgi:hypothetical protein